MWGFIQAERANLSDSAAFAFGMIINTVEVRLVCCRPLTARCVYVKQPGRKTAQHHQSLSVYFQGV